MNKRWLRILGASALVGLLCFIETHRAVASDWTGNINLQVGKRSMDSNDWQPVDKSTFYGVEGTWGKQDQVILFATDLYGSSESDRLETASQDRRLRSMELAIGFRKIWQYKTLRPYAGAGVSLVSEDFEVTTDGQRTEEQSDRTTGFWVGGGLNYRLGPHLNLGVAARYAPVQQVKVIGESIDASSGQVGVNVGWSWGEKKK